MCNRYYFQQLPLKPVLSLSLLAVLRGYSGCFSQRIPRVPCGGNTGNPRQCSWHQEVFIYLAIPLKKVQTRGVFLISVHVACEHLFYKNNDINGYSVIQHVVHSQQWFQRPGTQKDKRQTGSNWHFGAALAMALAPATLSCQTSANVFHSFRWNV